MAAPCNFSESGLSGLSAVKGYIGLACGRSLIWIFKWNGVMYLAPEYISPGGGCFYCRLELESNYWTHRRQTHVVHLMASLKGKRASSQKKIF